MLPPRGDYKTLLSYQKSLVIYQDYLWIRDLPMWAKDSREVTYLRNLAKRRQEGGLRERMTRARIEAREQKPKH